MNDLLVKGFVEVNGEKQPEQQTDTHWRAMGAHAEWNWRMTFPLTLPSKWVRLSLQAWDHNVVKYDMALATVTLDLAKLCLDAQHKEERDMPTSFQAERHGPIPAVNQDLFTKALDGCEARVTSCLSQAFHPNQMDPNVETNKFWLPLRFIEDQHGADGGLQVSIELIPRQLAGMQPAGLGRSDPNMNPTLPEPSSRFDFSIQGWVTHPCSSMYHILGPELMARVCCLVCVVVIVVLFTMWWPSIATLAKV